MTHRHSDLRNWKARLSCLAFLVFLVPALACAQATLTVPVGRTPDGAVVTERRRVDLEPSSRELVSEAAYRWSFGRDQAHEIKTGGFARFNPGHDADRPPEFGLGAHYSLAF